MAVYYYVVIREDELQVSRYNLRAFRIKQQQKRWQHGVSRKDGCMGMGAEVGIGPYIGTDSM